MGEVAWEFSWDQGSVVNENSSRREPRIRKREQDNVATLTTSGRTEGSDNGLGSTPASESMRTVPLRSKSVHTVLNVGRHSFESWPGTVLELVATLRRYTPVKCDFFAPLEP